MLDATVGGGAEAPAPNAPTTTLDAGLYDSYGDFTVNDDALNFHGVVSSPDVRVDVYATRQGGEPILIGQASPRGGASWNLHSEIPLADGRYTIQALPVEASTGVAGPLTTMAARLNVDNVGPRVAGVRLIPRLGRLVVTFRDFGGHRNAGSGLDLNTIGYSGSYAFAPLRAPWPINPPDPRWEATSVDTSSTWRRGPQRVVVTIGDGAPIPNGSYRLYMQSPGPALPTPPPYPYFVHIPYFAWGVRDQAGNPLDGGATSTIAQPDPNDFASGFVVLHGRAFRPRAAAPSNPGQSRPSPDLA
jgi:hypothetical protein